MMALLPVGVSLVLDNQVLLMDGLQQRRGQWFEVGNGLRRGRQAAALLLQEHLLHWKIQEIKRNDQTFAKLFFFKTLSSVEKQHERHKQLPQRWHSPNFNTGAHCAASGGSCQSWRRAHFRTASGCSPAHTTQLVAQLVSGRGLEGAVGEKIGRSY